MRGCCKSRVSAQSRAIPCRPQSEARSFWAESSPRKDAAHRVWEKRNCGPPSSRASVSRRAGRLSTALASRKSPSLLSRGSSLCQQDVLADRADMRRSSFSIATRCIFETSPDQIFYTTKAPPDERGGNRYVQPKATAPHLDSTRIGNSQQVARMRERYADDTDHPGYRFA